MTAPGGGGKTQVWVRGKDTKLVRKKKTWRGFWKRIVKNPTQEKSIFTNWGKHRRFGDREPGWGFSSGGKIPRVGSIKLLKKDFTTLYERIHLKGRSRRTMARGKD